MRITKEQALNVGKGILFGITCASVGAVTGAMLMKSKKDKEIDATKDAYSFEFESLDDEANALTARVQELEETIETYKVREEEYKEQIHELEVNSENTTNEACEACMRARSLNV